MSASGGNPPGARVAVTTLATMQSMGDALSPPEGTRVITTPGGPVWMEHGIVYETLEVTEIEEHHIRGLAEAVRELVGPDVKARIIADIRGVRWASGDSRALAASDEVRSLVAAQAILVGSPVTRVIGSFFARVATPPFPVRLFTSTPAAVEWLTDEGNAATA